MQINPDITLLFQLGIFLFAFLVMSQLIFKPVLKILARRRELTAEAKADAASLSEKTESMLSDYESQLSQARSQGMQEKAQGTQAGESEAAGILAKARQEAEAQLEVQRQELRQEAASAQTSLQAQASKLSQEMAEKLLGRKVGA